MTKRTVKRGLMLQDPVTVKGLAFTLYEDNDRGKTYVSARRATSELSYYFVIQSEYGKAYSSQTGDQPPKHILTLEIVSPTYLRKRALQKAWQSWGSPDLAPDNDLYLLEVLRQYGHTFDVAKLGGDNFAKTYKRLTQEAAMCTSLFGFYVDRYVNSLGDTGWDKLKGVSCLDKGDPADEAKACAELIACFALAGIADPELDPDSCAETTEELLTELSSAYVRDWLITHPYKRRRQKRAA